VQRVRRELVLLVICLVEVAFVEVAFVVSVLGVVLVVDVFQVFDRDAV